MPGGRAQSGLAGAGADRRHGVMRAKFISVVLVAWAVCAAGAGRLAADMATDLARVSVEAAGGLSAHAALRGLRAEGVTKVGDREVAFVLYSERPDRVRIETTSDGQTLVRAYDGVHVPWKRNGADGEPRALKGVELKDFLMDADFDSPLFLPAHRKISLDYAGEVTNEGRPCQKLLAMVRFTDLLTLYLDDETHLLVRKDVTKRVRGQSVVVETHFSDFAPLNKVLMPRRIRTVVGKATLHETVIQKWTANPEFPKNFFSPPAADWPLQ